MKKILLGLVAATAVAAPIALSAPADASPANAAAISKTKVIDKCHRAHVRPTRIIVACGDGGFQLHHLRYRHWGTYRARGVGMAMTHDCIPNCAESDFESHRVRFTFNKTAMVHGRRLFVHGRMRYIAGKPDWSPRRVGFPLPRPL